MREAAFRAYAMRHLRGAAPASYLANCRLIERETGVDLDDADLSEAGIAGVHDRLKAAGIPPARISDAKSAVRMYRRFRESSAAIPAPIALPQAASAGDGHPALAEWLEGASTVALLQASAAIVRTLRDRGIVRTGNGPLGDYAERLFTQAMDWTLATSATAGYDATDRAGLRFQIKARRRSGAGFRQLGIIRKLEGHHFDMVAAALFTPDFGVERALLIPHAAVVSHAKPVAHTNGWRLMFNDGLAKAPGVRDVTEAVCAAHEILGKLEVPL